MRELGHGVHFHVDVHRVGEPDGGEEREGRLERDHDVAYLRLVEQPELPRGEERL